MANGACAGGIGREGNGTDILVLIPREWSQEEKEEWFRKNERIIHRAIQSYRNAYEYDDLQQMANEATLKAFNAYDFQRGVKLSTYVYRAIRNEVNMRVRADNAQKRTAIIVPLVSSESEDGTSCQGAEEKDTSGTDALHTPQESVEITIERRETCNYIRKIVREQFSNTERLVFELMIAGETQVNIGERLHCSQAKVSNLQRHIREKLIYELHRAGFDLET